MQVDAIVCSPPYADSINSGSHGIDPSKMKLARHRKGYGAHYQHPGNFNDPQQYGRSAGQLGAMKEGAFEEVLRMIDAIVCSPPYADCPVLDAPRGRAGNACGGIGTQYRLGNRPKGAARKASGETAEGYGRTAGQLGAMREGASPTPEDTMHETTCPVDQWEKCYGETWRGLCVPDAFAHPAKFSRALIRRIYEHLTLPPGSVVLDPFGGVALGALDALLSGLHWVGVELEPKFHALGNANLDLWRSRWGHVPGFGTARLVQGDSRRLRAVLAGAVEAIVSSPPWESSNGERVGRKAPLDPQKNSYPQNRSAESAERLQANYGSSPGQLGATQGNTFWEAAAEIVRECFCLLKPGGVAVPDQEDIDFCNC